ncbi:MAG: hypothetical protein IPK69_08055 [Phycisphaerales bacterium]|nr:MAG: hypothetical protein IPK69_08055 [Phycisphaerales bacterium]
MTASHAARSHIKETVISMIIAFALAFVFRGFVIEPFQIPTGSMGPTLLGQHLQVRDENAGNEWVVAPRDMRRNTAMGESTQGTAGNPLKLKNPLTAQDLPPTFNQRLRSGDRIFVLKLGAPHRFDAIVFKNPTNPQENYIKRLLGLPGDWIALIDGDVFARTPSEADSADPTHDAPSHDAWNLPGWRCVHKPERIQRSMLQPVFDSQYTPKSGSTFRSPWLPATTSGAGGWDTSTGIYTYSASTPTTLSWDAARRPLRDYYAYDQTTNAPHDRFPVGDLAMSLGFRPTSPDAALSAVITARRHEFRADLTPTSVVLRVRSLDSGDQDAPWTDLAKANLSGALSPGQVANIEFWNIDQTLTLFVDGEEIARAEYAWSPDERVRAATNLGPDWSAIIARDPGLLTDPDSYFASTVRWEFKGAGPFTLYRVALARDVYYQPQLLARDTPARATHPITTMRLSPDQFFVCGDNSPYSQDARTWPPNNPWADEIDPTRGVVNRKLLIGKAFVVYFPAPKWKGSIPIPDFGRMRFIW